MSVSRRRGPSSSRATLGKEEIRVDAASPSIISTVAHVDTAQIHTVLISLLYCTVAIAATV